MTLYTSGDMQVCDHSLHLLREIYDWFYTQYNEFTQVDVEVNQCNLTESNCYGFCQIAEDCNDEGKQEFLVHIHHSLSEKDTLRLYYMSCSLLSRQLEDYLIMNAENLRHYVRRCVIC